MRKSWPHLVSVSLRQEFLLALWQTVANSKSDSPWTWVCARQTHTRGYHDRSGGSCCLRPREGGTPGTRPLVSLSCQLWSVSCCLWWNQSLGDFILHGWPAGMCFCLGSAALALIWGERSLFCIKLQIVCHLVVCVVCSTVCCISELPSNHSS